MNDDRDQGRRLVLSGRAISDQSFARRTDGDQAWLQSLLRSILRVRQRGGCTLSGITYPPFLTLYKSLYDLCLLSKESGHCLLWSAHITSFSYLLFSPSKGCLHICIILMQQAKDMGNVFRLG